MRADPIFDKDNPPVDVISAPILTVNVLAVAAVGPTCKPLAIESAPEPNVYV